MPCACLCDSPSKLSPCGMGQSGVSAGAPCPDSCPCLPSQLPLPALTAALPALQHEAATSQNVLVREACFRILGEGWSHVGQHISFSDWYRTELHSLLQQGDVQVRHSDQPLTGGSALPGLLHLLSCPQSVKSRRSGLTQYAVNTCEVLFADTLPCQHSLCAWGGGATCFLHILGHYVTDGAAALRCSDVTHMHA